MWFRVVKEHFSIEIKPSLGPSLSANVESDGSSSPTSPTSLTDLPDEVLLAVFMLLKPKELIR